MRKLWSLAVVLCLALAVGGRVSGAAEKAGPAPSVPRLIEQLADPDF